MARKRQNARAADGVVMFVAELAVVIPLLVMGGIVLLDAGLISLQLQKFSFVLMQAADYVVNLPPEEDPIPTAEGIVKDLCKQAGLKCTRLKVTVSKATVGDNEAIAIKATAKFPLLNGTALPMEINLDDTEVAIIPANRICGSIAISPYPYSFENSQAGESVYIPIIQPRHPMPVWQFPYETAINNLHHVKGPLPPTVAPVPKNAYFYDHPSIY